MLLKPPDVDPADSRYRDTVMAWGYRLDHAVESGLITYDESMLAIARLKRTARQ
jgi:hypothetical protein